MIGFKCRRCGRAFNLHDGEAGSRRECPGCGEGLVVPEKGARASVARSLVRIAAESLAAGAAAYLVIFAIGPRMSRASFSLAVYFAAVIGVGILTFRLIGRKRAERPTPAAADKLKAFLDGYPDHAAPPPEPEPTVAGCWRCGKPLEPGAVICAACGLVCPLCRNSVSGLAGRETHHIECPRCGNYWITRPLYDRMLYGNVGRLRMVFHWGRFSPDDTSKTDPWCERDLELLEDGWSFNQLMERRRRRRDST